MRFVVAIDHVAVDESLIRIKLGVTAEIGIVGVPAIERQRVRDNVFGSELVVDVAGEVVTGILVAAVDVLIGVVQWSAGRIVPQTVVDADDRAIVRVEAVGAEERELSALEAEIGAGIEAAGIGEAGVETATQA